MIPTSNFALLPSDADQDIGETHKNLARIKRKDIEESVQQMRSRGGHYQSLETGSSQLRIQAEGMQEALAQVSPIIFEECYCINKDKSFVERVKNTNEVSESKIEELYNEDSTVSTIDNGFVGVHLFVMVHGFQGNHNDMRLFKNQISLQHPDAVILLS